jgi:hypothetical protein
MLCGVTGLICHGDAFAELMREFSNDAEFGGLRPSSYFGHPKTFCNPADLKNASVSRQSPGLTRFSEPTLFQETGLV